MNVVSLNPDKKRKQDIIDVFQEMIQMVEDGEIDEFVACSTNKDGDVKIHAVCNDFVGGVGLYEIGKTIFMTQQN